MPQAAKSVWRISIALILVLASVGAWTATRSDSSVPLVSPTLLQLEPGHPGVTFGPGAVGLSTEAFELSSDHFSARHDRLVRLMKLLGPSVLRIGGNSVDLSWWTSTGEPPPPWASSTVTPADLSALSGLMQATRWKVLLGVDLGHFEPTRAADEARYAKAILGNHLLGIEIGNEPDDFGRKPKLRAATYTIAQYVQEAEAYGRALSSTGVTLFGPALGRTEWLGQLGPTAQMFSELTLHYYPTSTCIGVEAAAAAQPATADAELLSPGVREQEEETLTALMRAGLADSRPVRIGETNTAPCASSPSSNPVFASALWAMDWTLRAAARGVVGVSFHGNFSECGSDSESPICAPSERAARAGNVVARPELYGLLAARQLEGGRFVPAHLLGLSPLRGVSAWATVDSSGTIRVALDNFATGGPAQPVSIPSAGYVVTTMALTAPSVASLTGVTFGNAAVTAGGRWQPRPRKPVLVGRSTRVLIPPASALVVIMRPTRPGHHTRQ
jgi:hypothetical protein